MSLNSSSPRTPSRGSISCAKRDAPGKLCYHCQNVEQVRSQLVEAEQHVATLKSQYTAVRTAANEAHDPLVSRIPLEITSYIFELYVESYKSHHRGDAVRYIKIVPMNPLRLGAVCRSWRRIVWSLPQIWTTLTVYIRSAGHKHSAELALQWFKRSDPYPLSIYVYDTIHWTENKPSDDGWETDALSLVKVINLFTPRWLNLAFTDIASTVLSQIDWSNDIEQMSVLQHLTIHRRFEEPDFENIQSLSSKSSHKHYPAHITLTNMPLKSFDVGWTNVTHFIGSIMSPNDCFDIFRRAPNLTNCSLTVLQDIVMPVEEVHPGSIVSSVVRKLSLSESSTLWFSINDILDSLTLPSLEELYYCGDDPSRPLISLITRSSCQLQQLILQYPTIADDSLIELLLSVPRLKVLILRLYPQNVTQNLFENLSKTGSDSTKLFLLPNLENLQVNTYLTFTWDSVAEIYGDLQLGISEIAELGLHYPSRRQSLKLDIELDGPIEEADYVDPPSLLRFMQILLHGSGLTIRGVDDDNFLEESFKFHSSRGNLEPQLASTYGLILLDDHAL